jgi:hypothetical protein
MKKKLIFLNLIFHLYNKIFSNFFFLFHIANCAKFKMLKEKSRKFCIYTVNGGEILIGYTFCVGYTYRADCTLQVDRYICLSEIFPCFCPVCICVYIYTRAYIHTYIQIYIHTYINTYVVSSNRKQNALIFQQRCALAKFCKSKKCLPAFSL